MSRSLGRCQAGAEGKRTRHLGEELVAENDKRSSLDTSSEERTGDEKDKTGLHMSE